MGVQQHPLQLFVGSDLQRSLPVLHPEAKRVSLQPDRICRRVHQFVQYILEHEIVYDLVVVDDGSGANDIVHVRAVVIDREPWCAVRLSVNVREAIRIFS